MGRGFVFRFVGYCSGGRRVVVGAIWWGKMKRMRSWAVNVIGARQSEVSRAIREERS